MKKSFLAGIVVIAGVVILGCTSAGSKVIASPFTTGQNNISKSSSDTVITNNVKNTSSSIKLINQLNLSRLQEQYLLEFSQTLVKSNEIIKKNGSSVSGMDNSAGNAYELWKNQMDKLYQDISKNLSVSEKAELDSNQALWLNYKNNEIASIAKESDSIGPLLANDENIYLTQERCYYLFFYYLNNNSNNFNVSSLNSNINESSNEKNQIDGYLKTFNENLKESNKEILSTKNNQELLEVYNNISTIWNKELNNIYSKMVTNASKYKNVPQYNAQALEGPENEWINYKNQAIKNAENSYKDSSVGQIDAKKVEIAMIQSRIFYLLNSDGEFL